MLSSLVYQGDLGPHGAPPMSPSLHHPWALPLSPATPLSPSSKTRVEPGLLSARFFNKETDIITK